MIEIKYSRITIFYKLLLSIILLAGAAFLVYMLINWDFSNFEKMWGWSAAIISIVIFGRFFLILIFYFFKPNRLLFSYDENNLYVSNHHYPIKEIKRFTVPETKMGIVSSPTFLFYLENQKEPIAIPTDYLFFDKELDKIIEKMKVDLGLKGKGWTGN